MSIINEIPADAEVEMTLELQRVFRMEGCDPECHCCERSIVIGDLFTLAYDEVSGNDEMLCVHCDITALRSRREKLLQERMAEQSSGGFTRCHR